MIPKTEFETKKAAVPLPHLPYYIPLFNHAVRAFLRVGLPMGPVGLLTVRGRNTGKKRRNPVGLFTHDGRLYLFSTFGDVNWVRNLRSAKQAMIRHGWHNERVAPVELSPDEAAVILKNSVAPAFQGLGGMIFRDHFPLKPDSPHDDFVREAHRHPVFELRKVEDHSSVDAAADSRPGWVDSKSYPFKDNWMTIDGHRVHYVDEGPLGAPVILFVHPGPGWSFTYRHQIEQLRDKFRCVAPDLPGYGLSRAADGYQFTLLEQSRVLEEFVESLNLRKIVLWANDGGGPTGILALGPHAERVVALVVGGTFGWSKTIPQRDQSTPTGDWARVPCPEQVH
jgi:deazaflavin-dependent oxidoreductase (nitroreductase family)